jgi:4-amino-4-deoxy-L-arabinose transferase-like glycosyltransferase
VAESRRWWYAIGAIALVGLVLRITYVLTVGADIDLGADATWYQLQSGFISGGSGYLNPQALLEGGRVVPTAAFPPLWPGLLAIVDLAGPSSRVALQLTGACVGTTTVVLTGILGRRVANPTVALVGAGIVALSPAMIAADGSLMSDSLGVALIVLVAILASTATERPSITRFAMLGGALGLAMLARNDTALVGGLLVCVAVAGARAVSTRERFVRLAVSAGIALLLVTPWAVRNSVRFETPVAGSTNLGSLLEGANCDTTYRGGRIGMWDVSCLIETKRGGRSEADAASAAVRRGVEYALDHPARAVLVAPIRVARAFGLWNPLSQAPLEAEETRSEAWQIAAWAYALAMLLLAIWGFVTLARADLRRTLPLVAMVAGTIVVIVFSWGNPRFRLSAEPALAIAAAAAIVQITGSRWRRRQNAGAVV